MEKTIDEVVSIEVNGNIVSDAVTKAIHHKLQPGCQILFAINETIEGYTKDSLWLVHCSTGPLYLTDADDIMNPCRITNPTDETKDGRGAYMITKHFEAPKMETRIADMFIVSIDKLDVFKTEDEDEAELKRQKMQKIVADGKNAANRPENKNLDRLAALVCFIDEQIQERNLRIHEVKKKSNRGEVDVLQSEKRGFQIVRRKAAELWEEGKL